MALKTFNPTSAGRRHLIQALGHVARVLAGRVRQAHAARRPVRARLTRQRVKVAADDVRPQLRLTAAAAGDATVAAAAARQSIRRAVGGNAQRGAARPQVREHTRRRAAGLCTTRRAREDHQRAARCARGIKG